MAEPVRRTLRGAGPMLALAVVVILVVLGGSRGLWLPNLHNGLLALSFAAVGGYVLHQRPGHRSGLLFVTTGVVEAVLFAGRQLGHDAVDGTSRWAGSASGPWSSGWR